MDEAYVPTLMLSIAEQGAAASQIKFAQETMTAHWGLKGVGKPLTRLADKAKGDSNREIICGDKVFTSRDAVIGGDYGDTDSCDEFPFARSYQSGALNGITTAQNCVQLTAVPGGPATLSEALRWSIVVPYPLGSHVNPAAGCVRGHIPNKLNGKVGGAYTGLIDQNRLLDGDEFWVSANP